MRNAVVLIIGVMFCVWLVPKSDVQAQEDQPLPPYLYYYSEIKNALVIERADGTDSRLITELTPEDHNSVIMRRWSPSGQWFALSSYRSSGEGGVHAVRTQVISTDGQRRLDLGTIASSDLFMQWSPLDDTLLIVQTDHWAGTIHLQLLDVEKEIPLAETQLQFFGFDFPYLKVEWASDGQTAYASWWGYIVTLHLSGYTQVRVDSGDTSFHRGRLLYPYRIIRDESVLLRLEDMASGQYLEIEDQVWGRPNRPYDIRWSPTLEHALVYARPCADESCEGWLTLIDWTAGEVKTIQPTLSVRGLDRYCISPFESCELWSPDGRFAVLSDQDMNTYVSDWSNANFYVLDALTGETQLLGSGISQYRWMADETLLLHRDALSIFDPITGEEVVLNFTLDYAAYNFFPSPHGRFIGLISDPPTIIDRAGKAVAQTITHSFSTAANRYPDGYQWHDSEAWAMVTYIISFAGGGGGPRAAVVFDLDNTVRRELPSGGQAGFLPDNAVPYLTSGQPVSFKPDPVYTLPQEGRVEGVGWHPTDPNSLVTYSREAGLIFWSLNSGEPEITDQIVPEIPYESRFPIGLRLFWIPRDNLVGYYDFGGIYLIDQETGERVQVQGVNYPLLTNVNGESVARCSESGRSVVIERDSLPLGTPHMLSCGQTTFMRDQPLSENPFNYVNVDAGRLVPLQVDGAIWTGDARGKIAVVGGIYDCCISVASVETGELIDKFYGTAFSLALSIDSRWLATTSEGMTAIWDMSAYISEE